MVIDREYLEQTVKNLRQQELEAFEIVGKVRGALALTQALLARLDEKEPEAPAPTA